MTRPGRVEVYRELAHAEFYWGFAEVPAGWRWRFLAANGVQIGGSTEGYGRLRDLAHNLEQNFPDYRLLDQDCGLDGPTWFLHGMEFAHPGCAAEYAIPEDSVMGVGMRGVRIPVTVPAGIWLGSRR